MSNTTKSKKEKEIITEYESQVKGKKNTVAPDGHLEMDSRLMHLIRTLCMRQIYNMLAK